MNDLWGETPFDSHQPHEAPFPRRSVTASEKGQQKKKFSNARSWIRLDNVSVQYQKNLALHGLHLNLALGQNLFLLGPSGAGKTTLLKVLSGDTTGQITGNIKRLVSKEFKQKSARRFLIAHIYQDLKLCQKWSVLENLNVAYDPNIYKSHQLFAEDAEKLLNYFGVKGTLNKSVQQLNGGARQVVAMVRAFLARPDIILADEPTSWLDEEKMIKFYNALDYYHRQMQMNWIWATHDQSFARKMAGEVVMLEHGKITYSGHACFI